MALIFRVNHKPIDTEDIIDNHFFIFDFILVSYKGVSYITLPLYCSKALALLYV